MPLELGVQSLNHWTAREVLVYPRVEGQVIVDVLPYSGIEPVSLISLALTSRSFTTSATWEALVDREVQSIGPLHHSH